MKSVWLLMHSYEQFGIGDDKVLGIYETQELAEEAKRHFQVQQGFADYPTHCFCITEYQLNQAAGWHTGFFRWGDSDTYYTAFVQMTQRLNQWLSIDKTPAESWEDAGYYEALTEISWKLRNTDDPEEFAAFIHHILVSCAEMYRPPQDCLAIAEQLLSEVNP
ncbi:MAG: hypothetical protein II341_02325 [Oscillospiraceae bacterium]|nr:hypothetical protein [Oscillospiraceae bacterium]